MPGQFDYGMNAWAPFRDKAVCERVRGIRRKDFCNHPNPKLKIEVLRDDELAFRRVWYLFSLIKKSSEEGKRLVLILPNPHPQYVKLAFLINQFKVRCTHLHIFNMDEWADEDGNEAPEDWPNGFMYGMLNYFFYRVDPALRPPRSQIQGPTRRNLADYDRMIADAGEADLCDGGIGWSGHVAFIDPRSPEFSTDDLEEFKAMGTRVMTLNPFTVAQSSLDADFGMSGDWSWVPPRGITVGPAQILAARHRTSFNSFTLGPTQISWQRFSVRLAVHGPVSPHVPASILQIGPTELFVTESIAADITVDRDVSWYA
jgi:glucosamine-6-phosphate deaminase